MFSVGDFFVQAINDNKITTDAFNIDC